MNRLHQRPFIPAHDDPGVSIAVFGLTFKPNTDDMREAPSIPLVTALKDFGARVRAYDPIGIEQARGILPDVTFWDGPSRSTRNALRHPARQHERPWTPDHATALAAWLQLHLRK